MAAGHAATERSPLANEMLLPDELGEVARSHPGGQRLLLGRRLEKRLGTSAAGFRARRGHWSMVRGRASPRCAAC
jgi:hypothetical protein